MGQHGVVSDWFIQEVFVVQGEKLTKPKYVYKTAEELIATGPTRRQLPEVTSELAKVKVIDMTGKEQRILSGTIDICNASVNLIGLVILIHIILF